MQKVFDPFMDRLSRDIRNDLSASLRRVLSEGTMEPALAAAEKYLQRNPAPHYLDYIKHRLSEYEKILNIAGHEDQDFFRLALILWNRQLFFEVHELLEQEWLRAEGTEKQVLQAMIRAAGVYIKLECGYLRAAGKIAGRAIPVLEEHRKYLAGYFDPALLLEV